MATVHQISSQNLECPICLALFNQPTSLVCSHTFCKECLECVFQTQPDQQTITCPVCRKVTSVPSGDVGKLQINVPLSSLVDEVKTENPTCTVCEMDDKSPAVFYCQDCGRNMCKSCEESHSTWKLFASHSTVALCEMLSGKVPLKRRRKCKKHPNDDEECFCTGCREYICCKCGMLGHLQEGHKLEEAAVHEEKLMKNIKELKEKTKSKIINVENHIEFIETQRNEIRIMLGKINDDIDKTYEEYMKLLSVRREALRCQVKRWSEKFTNELQAMEEESHQTIRNLNAMEELVTNGVKVPLEKDALLAHDTLCENLTSFLGRDDPDDQSPRGVGERAQKISFRKCVDFSELRLGELNGYTWKVKADVELPSKDSMNCITLAPDGQMAVGSHLGGIHFYSFAGELKQTVLKHVRVQDIRYLSDCRSVVRDMQNQISLYTPQWWKLGVTFRTMSFDEGWFGGLNVDRDDNIYVGYRKPKKILLFTPKGGEPVREIICEGHSPCQLFSCHTTGKLILTDLLAVFCLDGNGTKENVLEQKESMFAWPAVCRDDSVIVAWVKHEEDLHTTYEEYELQTQEATW
ncbi:uncharacterized protein [Diadema antillarum]|uniref:uncharacterized protein n=1 Tax=Diadema antillarum TaxID=105358 RepID=UPI003A83B5C6